MVACPGAGQSFASGTCKVRTPLASRPFESLITYAESCQFITSASVGADGGEVCFVILLPLKGFVHFFGPKPGQHRGALIMRHAIMVQVSARHVAP